MDNRKIPDDVIDEKLYIQQQKDFQDLIINGHNSNFFKVEDYESSWGKSTLALNTLPLYKQKNPDKRVLYVSERIKQCTDNADYVNSLYGKDSKVASAIIGNTPKQQRKEILQDSDIIFITHERYRRLCRTDNEDERELFTNNRHLLIIDEKLEMCKLISFCVSKNSLVREEIFRLVGEKGVTIYDEIVSYMLIYIRYLTPQEVINKGLVHRFDNLDVKHIDSLIDKLIELITLNVKDKRIFYKEYEENGYQTILERIKDLREFYTEQCIVCYEKFSDKSEIVLYTPNYSLEMWKLENNIILDATASIDQSYSYNKKLFHISYEKKVFRHNNWFIRWANVNTTSYGRTQKYTNFDDALNTIILNDLGIDKTLVYATRYDDVRPVTPYSDEFEKMTKFKSSVTHNGVINSSNEHKELSNFANATLNTSFNKDYTLRYMYYSKRHIENWRCGNNRGQQEFNNKNIEFFKIHDMARGIYQAMKRINRNWQYNSILVFLCHREDVRNIVFSMFDKINIEHYTEYEELFEQVPKKTTKILEFEKLCNYIIENNCLPPEILEVLETTECMKFKENALKGRIQKKVFEKAVNSKAFGTNILKKEKKFLKDKGIIETNNMLIFKGF